MAQFKKGAENAQAAGFDGVELHGANGYLLDQFLRDGANRRTDAYGGNIRNRARFPLEVTEAVVAVWGPERVGYKVSPNSAFNSMSDSDPIATFSYFADELSRRGLLYLHATEGVAGPMAPPAGAILAAPELRKRFKGTLILNGGYDAPSADAAIARGAADLIAFGVPFLANPDLPIRYTRDAPLNAPDQATFYAGEAKGYIDYPVHWQVQRPEPDPRLIRGARPPPDAPRCAGRLSLPGSSGALLFGDQSRTTTRRSLPDSPPQASPGRPCISRTSAPRLSLGKVAKVSVAGSKRCSALAGQSVAHTRSLSST